MMHANSPITPVSVICREACCQTFFYVFAAILPVFAQAFPVGMEITRDGHSVSPTAVPLEADLI